LVASHFFILNLSGSFNQIVHFVDFWDLLLVNKDLVFGVAELALPHQAVFTHDWLSLAGAIEHTLALRAENWVTGSHGTGVLETRQRDLEDICIRFHNIGLCCLLFLLTAL